MTPRIRSVDRINWRPGYYIFGDAPGFPLPAMRLPDSPRAVTAAKWTVIAISRAKLGLYRNP